MVPAEARCDQPEATDLLAVVAVRERTAVNGTATGESWKLATSTAVVEVEVVAEISPRKQINVNAVLHHLTTWRRSSLI